MVIVTSTTARPLFFSAAEEAGYNTGLAVLAGKVAVEVAGDRWVKWADRSIGQGVAFERGYDSTGATR
jgi:hypothetical protein